ncbi:MAG: carboxylesterase/lipase family protein, partial [Dehalococcoidia bacterium]
MTIVSTTAGHLRGAAEGALHVFRGIPFAKPPVGDLRFRAPQPPEPWTGVRDALAFRPAALQVASPVGAALAMDIDATDEDCLYLNVWTPSPEGRRPVMVWVHGGAFVIGSGSQPLYDGSGLAARGDVVVVTLNYRLGLFGFLHGKTLCGDALDSTGNEAILDQVAALRWVRDEIAAFGGDPDNVTVFGESAGAISVAALLGMPAARGLFQKAILESGSANLVATATAASETAAKILAHFGLEPAEAHRLRAIPAADLLEAQTAVTPRTSGVAYGPVIDGDVLPRSPFDAVAAGETRGVALLGGTTMDELKLFAFMDPGVFQLDEDGLQARIEAVLPGRGAAAIATYRSAREGRGEPVTPFETYEAIMTDNAMRYPVNRLLELQAAHTPQVYAYLFTHPSPSLGGMLGACHAIDLPFVFGTYGLEAMKT